MSNMIFRKKIGSTTFHVKIRTAETGTETVEEKILRMISNHPLANGEKCDILNVSQMSRSA